MQEVKSVLNEVKLLVSRALQEKVRVALEEAAVEIRAQVFDEVAQRVLEQRIDVVQRFARNIEKSFDDLLELKHYESREFDYANLSLVEEEDLEAIIALEGMVSHARKTDIREYLRLTARLDELIASVHVDESNNPTDPEQIGSAFSEALRPVGLQSKALLIVYREFNKQVFRNLEEILERANQVLIRKGILPDLGATFKAAKAAGVRRSKDRPSSSAAQRAFMKRTDPGKPPAGDVRQVMPVIQQLMEKTLASGSGAIELGTGLARAADAQQGMMIGNQRVELLSAEEIVPLLEKIQADTNCESFERESGSLTRRLGDALKEAGSEQVLKGMDQVATDLTNLVSMVFDALAEDVSVPQPIRRILGSLEVRILQIAMLDDGFLEQSDHPAKRFIDELAVAGISWTDDAKLESDPLFGKMQELVNQFAVGYKHEDEFVLGLIGEFHSFKLEQTNKARESENRLRDEAERAERLEEVRSYASEKIRERILDEDIHPFVLAFLEKLFRKFVVKVIMKEGPGGVSWKPIMNTVDVLLWTVQSDRQEGDEEKYLKIKKRLLSNLARALNIGGVDRATAMKALRDLQKLQESTFHTPDESLDDLEISEGDDEISAFFSDAKIVQAPLIETDVHLVEVTNYPEGIWLEFDGEADQRIRCTLAAKIDTIDKYVFVNSEGVKVIEKSRMGLARELKAGTVRVVSETPLFDRALETVIARLRRSAAA